MTDLMTEFHFQRFIQRKPSSWKERGSNPTKGIYQYLDSIKSEI